MILVDCIQGSEEWFAHRCGIPSASNFGKILSPTGKSSKQAEKYMLQLAGERVLGKKAESFQSQAMLDGIETEVEALGWFEYDKDTDVQFVGLCYKNKFKKFSCSPDGLLKNGGLEIKCPILTTHVEYLLADKLPSVYIPQVQGSMFVTGREWWDFMSYFPNMPRLIKRIYRDEKYIRKLARELYIFCDKLDETHAELLKKVEG